MIVTPANMRAAYEFLRKVSFKGIRLPASRRVNFAAKRLRTHHGYAYYPEFGIDADTGTSCMTRLIQIIAHEMIHLALEQNAASNHEFHDENFQALARIIEHEMGWPKGSV